MSVQGFTPVTTSLSFESAVTSKDNKRGPSLFDCIVDVLTMTTTKPADYGNQGDKDKHKLQPKKSEDEKPDERDGEYKVDVQNPQQDIEAIDDTKTAAKEAESARNNWLELRARVERVDPRVFAFEKDPKYLQQCEEAKQRRALAAATSVSPGWH